MRGSPAALDKDAMRAEIAQRYRRLAQEASGEVPEEIPAPQLQFAHAGHQ